MNQLGGEINLSRIVADAKIATPSADATLLQKEAWDRLMAYIYLDRADRDKYGMFIDNLKVQHSLKHDQYPKTLDGAVEILQMQRFEKTHHEKKKKTFSKDKQTFKKKDDDKKTNDSPSIVSEITLAQTEGVCYCCGKKGHYSNTCRHRDKPQSEWVMNKTKEIQNVLKRLLQIQTTCQLLTLQVRN